MRYRRLLLTVGICQLLSIHSFADSLKVDYFSARSIQKFASVLFQEKDYLRAAGEYQRFLALFATANDSVLYKIAICYEMADQRDRAISYYDKINQNYPLSPLIDFSQYQIATNLYLLQRYRQSNDHIDRSLPMLQTASVRTGLQYLYGVNLMYQNNWGDADRYFANMAQSSGEPETRQQFLHGKGLAEGRFKIARRSPYIAGLLSTLLPGSGKVYTGQTGDGVYSLLMIALSGYLSWDGFADNGIRSVKGWLFGAFTGFFYSGNIYGSVISARQYNERRLMQYLDGITLQINFYHEIDF